MSHMAELSPAMIAHMKRTLASVEIVSAASDLAKRGVYPQDSGVTDYFFSGLVFISIPIFLACNFLLWRSLSGKGMGSLVGTPFQKDLVERGFTFSHVASSITSSAKHLLSFGSSRRAASDTETHQADTVGFTDTSFSLVSTDNKKGPLLPTYNPPAYSAKPVDLTLPAIRPVSPRLLHLPNLPSISVNAAAVRGSHNTARSAGGISVTTSTHTYEDHDHSSDEELEMGEITRATKRETESDAMNSISVSDARERGKSLPALNPLRDVEQGRTQDEEPAVPRNGWASNLMDKILPSAPRNGN